MGHHRRQIVEMALIFPQDEFQHILRVLNTNVDGRHKVPFAITSIKGVGRRFANMVCKKAEVNLNKRAGELTSEEIEKLIAVIQRPLQFLPPWFVNRKKDIKDGKTSHVYLIFSTRRCASPSSASGKLGLIVVSVMAGVSACVDRRHAPLAVTVRRLVLPVRRANKQSKLSYVLVSIFFCSTSLICQ